MLPLQKAGATLLGHADPEPVEIVNSGGASAVLLVCEHAGRLIPAAMGDLGIEAPEMDRHIAYDLGAEGLSRKLSALLDAPLVLQRYSRLVIDCNRPFEALDCMPDISDGTRIPMNCDVSPAERVQRFDQIHRPFHDAVAGLLDRRARDARPAILVAVHSFTPRFGGEDRPWHLGVCSNRDDSFARRFMDCFVAGNPAVTAAHNEPYPVDDISDYTIPVHGEGRRIPHVLLEIRNDEISHQHGQQRWARRIADALLQAASSYSVKAQPGAA